MKILIYANDILFIIEKIFLIFFEYFRNDYAWLIWSYSIPDIQLNSNSDIQYSLYNRKRFHL